MLNMKRRSPSSVKCKSIKPPRAQHTHGAGAEAATPRSADEGRILDAAGRRGGGEAVACHHTATQGLHTHMFTREK